MARTNKYWAERAANRVDPKAVRVGDRVKHGDTLGTVVRVGRFYGEILWDGDAEPVESHIESWRMCQKA